MAAYDFIDQNIVASCLIQPHDDDSFYNPVRLKHTGYAFDGQFYSLGVQQLSHQAASWWTEFTMGGNAYRGDQADFPTYGLVLLSPVSLVILDQANPVALATLLPLWMQFLLGDNNALANNFNAAVQGFLPAALSYADGIISVTYSPDPGNQPGYLNSQQPIIPPYPAPYPAVGVISHMVVNIDFVQDSCYLDVGVGDFPA